MADTGRERNDDGQFADRIPADSALSVFESRTDRARPLTAGDVADALDCSRRTAHNKLETLVDRGLVATRKVGARSRVFWIPLERDGGGGDDRPAAVSNAARTVELPGTGALLDQRRDALLAAYDYLREQGEARKADFLQAAYPDQPAGFESAEGWWNAIQPALCQLPGVDPPKARGHIWTLRRDD